MSDYAAEVRELCRRAADMPFDAARVELFGHAVGLADAHGDAPLACTVRQELVFAALYAGQPERAFVEFAWCLGQSDRDPHRFPCSDLLPVYLDLVALVDSFSSVSKGHILGMFDDLERRCRQAGSTCRAAYLTRRNVLTELGDQEAADRAAVQFERADRDWLCEPVYETCVTARCLAVAGRDAAAVEAAAPVLDGRLPAPEQSLHFVYALLLMPLTRLGRTAEAARMRRAAGPTLFRWAACDVEAAGWHLAHLALRDPHAAGVGVLERFLGRALETHATAWRFESYLGARLLLDCLADAGTSALKLRLPEPFPARTPDGVYAVADLAAWFDRELADLAARFDVRNGNRRFGDRVRTLPEMKRYARPRAARKGRPA